MSLRKNGAAGPASLQCILILQALCVLQLLRPGDSCLEDFPSYPLVMTNVAIENSHLFRGFSHKR